jgi:hypothetical protein
MADDTGLTDEERTAQSTSSELTVSQEALGELEAKKSNTLAKTGARVSYPNLVNDLLAEVDTLKSRIDANEQQGIDIQKGIVQSQAAETQAANNTANKKTDPLPAFNAPPSGIGGLMPPMMNGHPAMIDKDNWMQWTQAVMKNLMVGGLMLSAKSSKFNTASKIKLAAMFDGMKKGDEVAYKQALADYRTNMDSLIQQRAVDIKQQEDIIKARHLSTAEKMQQYRLWSLEQQHLMGQQAKSLDAAVKYTVAQQKIQEQAIANREKSEKMFAFEKEYNLYKKTQEEKGYKAMDPEVYKAHQQRGDLDRATVKFKVDQLTPHERAMYFKSKKAQMANKDKDPNEIFTDDELMEYAKTRAASTTPKTLTPGTESGAILP